MRYDGCRCYPIVHLDAIDFSNHIIIFSQCFVTCSTCGYITQFIFRFHSHIGTLNAWERGPYISDIGYVADNTTNTRPTADELEAGATPGFKRCTDKGGSAVGQYTTLAYNFLLGNYNVNSNLETDDGSSRYLMYRNYFVYSTSATDFAMNAHWNYEVDNVRVLKLKILLRQKMKGVLFHLCRMCNLSYTSLDGVWALCQCVCLNSRAVQCTLTLRLMPCLP